jgi:hypothetical protein
MHTKKPTEAEYMQPFQKFVSETVTTSAEVLSSPPFARSPYGPVYTRLPALRGALRGA